MSTEFLLKIASVLDELAAKTETQEAEKTASVQLARTADLTKLAEQYTVITGEELDVSKLAGLDDSAISTMKSVVEKTASVASVRSMGGPSDRFDGPKEPRNKKEAAAAATDRFTDWILKG